MFRIGFVGVPGSGKTSTARAVSAFCRRDEKLKRVELVAEYARRYITKYGSIDSMFDQYRILEKQLEWENVIPQDHTDLLITDSPIHLGWFYVTEIERTTLKDNMVMNDVFKRMCKLNYPNRYDIIFQLPPTLKAVNDGIRPKSNFNNEWRAKANERIKYVFEVFKPKHFIEIKSEGLEERVEEAVNSIHALLFDDVG